MEPGESHRPRLGHANALEPRTPARRSAAADEFRFLRGLIEGMRCGVLTVDLEGRVTLFNEPARQILGLDEVPPRGAPIERVLADHPQLVQVLREAFAMTSLPNRAELDLGSVSRHGKRIGFTLSMVRIGTEPPCGAAVFFKDLTPIEHKEEQDRLKDRLVALGQMAASLAHEIRNPLASIEVSCKLLERRLGPGGAKDLLQKITAEVRRLDRSVNSSLEFVRPVAPSFAPGRLIPLLDEAIAVAVGRHGGAGIEIRRCYKEPVTPFLMDAALLRQVFENLILNALEALGDHGRVTVGAEVIEAPGAASIPYCPREGAVRDLWQSVDRFAVVRIADDGPGIDEEGKDRIFYPFFTTKKHGSGVGLAVAKKIVDSHRGLIDVESAPGAGAVFHVRLPMVPGGSEVSTA